MLVVAVAMLETLVLELEDDDGDDVLEVWVVVCVLPADFDVVIV